MEERNFETKKKKIATFGNVILVGMLLLLVISLLSRFQPTKGEGVHLVRDGWYIVQDGQIQQVSLPLTIEAGEQLILCNDRLGSEYSGQMLTIKAAVYEPQIMLGEQSLYQYSEEWFPANEPMKGKMDCDIRIPRVYAGGETLTILLQSQSGQYEIPAVYSGTDAAVFVHHLSEIALMLFLNVIMVVLSVVAIGVALYLCQIRLYDPRFVNAASFLLLCAIWSITDAAMVQQYSGYVPVVRLISFYAFMLMPIPMIRLVRNSGDMKKYKILDACVLVFYLNALIQGGCYYLGWFSMIDMLIVTHVLLAVGVGILIAVLVKEYRNHPSVEMRIVWNAFRVLGGSGVFALILYWLFQFAHYELLFLAGILIFVVTLLYGLIITMASNVRYKTEMLVYQRLAKEDSLTGIANRLAFEEQMKEIEAHADSLKNAALIFMDVNGLKKINDQHGHNAGDELIIAASRCVERAFTRWGHCYRIGGDEFCALILDPDGDAREWYGALDQEIQNYNSCGKWRLSIARGISYLRDEEGRIKRFSDWKYEADQNMYRDKGLRKR